MKKILIPVLAFTILTAPIFVSAEYTGLVKCDGVVLPGEDKTKCDFVALMNQIKFMINWGMGMLTILAVVVAAYAGVQYMIAGFTGNVSAAQSAKEKLTNMLWGVLIILFAWLIVRTILNWLVRPGLGLDLIG